MNVNDHTRDRTRKHKIFWTKRASTLSQNVGIMKGQWIWRIISTKIAQCANTSKGIQNWNFPFISSKCALCLFSFVICQHCRTAFHVFGVIFGCLSFSCYYDYRFTLTKQTCVIKNHTTIANKHSHKLSRPRAKIPEKVVKLSQTTDTLCDFGRVHINWALMRFLNIWREDEPSSIKTCGCRCQCRCAFDMSTHLWNIRQRFPF